MDLLNRLKGGDLRSIGKANQIVKEVGTSQELFDEVFQGIFANDPLIRMRAADVIEKASKNNPKLLIKHKYEILENLDNYQQQEVKWHIALILSYLELNRAEIENVFDKLSQWIETDKSKIVKVNSIQALADIAIKDPTFKKRVIRLINEKIETESSAFVSRGKKLLNQLT